MCANKALVRLPGRAIVAARRSRLTASGSRQGDRPAPWLAPTESGPPLPVMAVHVQPLGAARHWGVVSRRFDWRGVGLGPCVARRLAFEP
jgi:hypothetical protein